MDNNQLDITGKNADWDGIQKYALSFNAYEYWNETSKAAKIANQQRKKYHEEDTLTNDVTKLKTCLFIEQRRHHHYGWTPSDDMNDINNLIDKGLMLGMNRKN